MIKKALSKINEWLEDGLRGVLGRLTPDRRVILVVTMLVFFSGLSIYMTVSGIYNFGKDKGYRMQVEQIEALKLQLEEQRKDSINNQLNELEYGKREFE